MSTDPRIQALRDIVTNLTDCPADQTADFLAEAAQLSAHIKGLAETERLIRATDSSADGTTASNEEQA